jgi:putative transposase
MPRVVTDKPKSSGAALRDLQPGIEHRQHRYLNNRVENSHQPTRQRERHLQGFKSPGQAQRFLAPYGLIAQHSRPRRYRFWAAEYRREMTQRFETWREIIGTPMAA